MLRGVVDTVGGVDLNLFEEVGTRGLLEREGLINGCGSEAIGGCGVSKILDLYSARAGLISPLRLRARGVGGST